MTSVEQFAAEISTNQVFNIVKNEQRAFWGNQPVPSTCLLGDFGRTLGQSLDLFTTQELETIFNLLENSVSSTDDYLVTAATTGFIEALDISIAEDVEKQARVFSMLGVESKKYLNAWYSFLGVTLFENKANTQAIVNFNFFSNEHCLLQWETDSSSSINKITKSYPLASIEKKYLSLIHITPDKTGIFVDEPKNSGNNNNFLVYNADGTERFRLSPVLDLEKFPAITNKYPNIAQGEAVFNPPSIVVWPRQYVLSFEGASWIEEGVTVGARFHCTNGYACVEQFIVEFDYTTGEYTGEYRNPTQHDYF